MKGEAPNFQNGPYITDLYYWNPADLNEKKSIKSAVKSAVYVSFLAIA